MSLPSDAKVRKEHPIYSGFLRYFPDAVAEVAHLSKVGNDQHNPGKPLHWDRSKSGDELDALSRHLVDAGTRDTDGERHSAKVAWRAMANLQKEIERDRALGRPAPIEPHTDTGTGIGALKAIADRIVPEEDFGALAGTPVAGSGHPEMADVADRQTFEVPDGYEIDFGPDGRARGVKLTTSDFQPLTFSRQPRTEDWGPEYEDDGLPVADADNAPLREVTPIPDEEHNPAQAPATPSVITMRRTSEDQPVWRHPANLYRP